MGFLGKRRRCLQAASDSRLTRCTRQTDNELNHVRCSAIGQGARTNAPSQRLVNLLASMNEDSRGHDYFFEMNTEQFRLVCACIHGNVHAPLTDHAPVHCAAVDF